MKPQFTVKGYIPTFWHSSGIDHAWLDRDVANHDPHFQGQQLYARCQWPVVDLHAWPGKKTANILKAMRMVNPTVQHVVGAGMDGVAKDVAGGRRSLAWGVSEFVRIAKVGLDQGTIAVMYDEEGGWKSSPSSVKGKLLRQLMREGHEAVDAAYPELPILSTTFDHPTYHSTFPWEAMVGAGSPVTACAYQVYAAPNGDVMAHRGDLPRRQARAKASYEVAVRKGWIGPDVAAGQAGDLEDVDWLGYYQLHHVPLRDTAQHLAEEPVSFGWAAPTRMDQDGYDAMLAVTGLHRLGFTGPGCVRRFQEANGITPDNVVGRTETLPAILRAAAL